MNRPVSLVILCLSLATATGSAQTNAKQSPWTVKVETDKLTDAQKVILSAQVQPTATPYVYELTMTCAEDKRRITIGAFDMTHATANGDAMQGRPIPFCFACGLARGASGLTFRYRIDKDSVASGSLYPAFSNVGAWDILRVQEASAAFAGGEILVGDNLTRLPNERLIVADVFPGETVEFSFTTLGGSERKVIQQACFAAQQGAAQRASAIASRQECLAHAEQSALAQMKEQEEETQRSWCDSTRNARHAELVTRFVNSVRQSRFGGENVAKSVAEFLDKNPTAIRQTTNNPASCRDRDLGVDENAIVPVLDKYSIKRDLAGLLSAGASGGRQATTRRSQDMAREGTLILRSTQYTFTPPFPTINADDKAKRIEQAQLQCGVK